MKEKFIDWRPASASKSLLIDITKIFKHYKELGYRLTLRQLYYQLVSRDIIPNSTKEYSKLGNVVSKGRLSGLLDWSMIEDRVRIPKRNQHWNTPNEILKAAAHSFYMDRWKGQEYYVEVWVEKDAVSNIIEPVCSKYDVLFMANRGYASQTAIYDAFHRVRNSYAGECKQPVVIYLGDHDPSGIDMTRDITQRLETFLESDGDCVPIIRRIALNLDQVKKYQPPENPAKMTDSRFKAYREKYGFSSWELDALEPSVLETLVENEINRWVDMDLFNKIEDKEDEQKQKLIDLSDNTKF